MTTASTPPGGPAVIEQNSEPQPIDGARALQLLREVVAERPDYVYQKPGRYCVYAVGDQPSCIVGHVLARAGFPVDQLAGVQGNVTVLVQDHPGWLGRDARSILAAAQHVQDPGEETWSAALAAAELKATDLGVSA
jgi:hypothetical protein